LTREKKFAHFWSKLNDYVIHLTYVRFRICVRSVGLMPKNVVIYGAGGHATSIAGVLTRLGFTISFFIDEMNAKDSKFGIPVLKSLNDIRKRGRLSLVVAVGDNFRRQQAFDKIKLIQSSIHLPTIIDPSSIICTKVEVGQGTVIMPGTVLGTRVTVGDFCIINTKSTIDHESNMCDFASLAPGVTLAGNVQIGERSAIMMNAAVSHEIEIGKDCLIGASSFVASNLLDNSVAVGAPSKVIRMRDKEEKYY